MEILASPLHVAPTPSVTISGGDTCRDYGPITGDHINGNFLALSCLIPFDPDEVNPSTGRIQATKIAEQACRVLNQLMIPERIPEPQYISRDVGIAAGIAKAKLLATTNSVNDLQEMYRKYDTHKRGKIIYDDFVESLLATNSGLSKDEVRTLTKTIDHKRTGHIHYANIINDLERLEREASSPPSKFSTQLHLENSSKSLLDSNRRQVSAVSLPLSSSSSSSSSSLSATPIGGNAAILASTDIIARPTYQGHSSNTREPEAPNTTTIGTTNTQSHTYFNPNMQPTLKDAHPPIPIPTPNPDPDAKADSNRNPIVAIQYLDRSMTPTQKAESALNQRMFSYNGELHVPSRRFGYNRNTSRPPYFVDPPLEKSLKVKRPALSRSLSAPPRSHGNVTTLGQTVSRVLGGEGRPTRGAQGDAKEVERITLTVDDLTGEGV